jgi:hypothetical protein
MHYVILALLVGVSAFFAMRWFVRQEPARIAAALAHSGKWLMIAVGTFMVVRGNFIFGLPLIAVGVAGLLGLGKWAGTMAPGAASRSAGKQSQVRSRMLEMHLDHDSGEIDGMVLKGSLEGRQLSDLDIEELLTLLGECDAEGDQSAALLEAFLDRNHSEWRDGDDQSDSAETDKRRRDAGGAMTRAEAFEVLGLPTNAGKEAIRRAHKGLMKQFHPDRGGSSYIAAKINQAKDILLG